MPCLEPANRPSPERLFYFRLAGTSKECYAFRINFELTNFIMRSFSHVLFILVAALFIGFIPVSFVSAATTVSGVSPTTVTANQPSVFSATVSSDIGIQSCNLYVDMNDEGEMEVNGNVASKTYTFTSGGSRLAFVFCRDIAGKPKSGPNTAIWINGEIVNTGAFSNNSTPAAPAATSASPVAETSQTPVPTETEHSILLTLPQAGSLIKLACEEGAEINDPCKAVYYVGRDNKRHSFPNSKVFFTWYAGFENVISVTAEIMASLPIGKNVTYRPGIRLVKFQSLNKVYAISKTEGLRWVTTEALASEKYANDWNTKVDDIDDSFFGNYKFGNDILNSGDYNVSAETTSAGTIDDIL